MIAMHRLLYYTGGGVTDFKSFVGRRRPREKRNISFLLYYCCRRRRCIVVIIVICPSRGGYKHIQYYTHKSILYYV